MMNYYVSLFHVCLPTMCSMMVSALLYSRRFSCMVCSSIFLNARQFSCMICSSSVFLNARRFLLYLLVGFLVYVFADLFVFSKFRRLSCTVVPTSITCSCCGWIERAQARGLRSGGQCTLRPVQEPHVLRHAQWHLSRSSSLFPSVFLVCSSVFLCRRFFANI